MQPGTQNQGRRTGRTRRAAFTLAEMLAVIVVAAVLLTMIGSAMVQAKRHAKRARAEAQLRDLAKAWMQYWMVYTNWPASLRDQPDVPMTYANMAPLFSDDTVDNPLKIPFISIKLESNESYLDPWKHVYLMTFKASDIKKTTNAAAMHISIALPNRDRYRN